VDNDRGSSNIILRAERAKNATKEIGTYKENDIKMGLKGMWYCGVKWILLAKNIVTGHSFIIRL
jgi:hypothetical protein